MIIRKSCVMLKPIRCDFLAGSLTDQASMEGMVKDLDSHTASTHELLFYKKNGTALWLEVGTKPSFDRFIFISTPS